MAKAGKLLVLDDNEDILSAVKLMADRHFETIITISNPNVLLSTLRQHRPDVLLMDMNFRAGINNGNEGLYWLQETLKMFSDTKVVLFTAYADVDVAVKGMKLGACDFVVKPWKNDELLTALQNAYNLRDKKSKKATMSAVAATPMFWGESAEMARIRNIVNQVACTDANILITGENGTGKEVLACEIHQSSMRCRQQMVSLDMGAIPDTLFESELFGHKKGAFTDATADRKGKLEAANESTLFMDEIGNLPLHLQAKLLVAIQNRTITPLGSNKPVPIDIRIISATNRNLFEMADRGEFRQDLFYRINTVVINLPPLRNRTADIIPLAKIFLADYAQKYGKTINDINPAACNQLTAYRWPGNIRELQNTMHKAAIMCNDDIITPSHLELRTIEPTTATGTIMSLEDLERKTIADTIYACNGNLSMAAQKLGITRQTLYNKIKRFGL